MSSSSPIALVTGANRGLGLEIARQLAEREYTVIMTARDPTSAENAVASLLRDGLNGHPGTLDVTDPASIDRLRAKIESQFGRLDVLVNNAGVLLDRDRTPLTADLAVVQQTLDVNTLGVWRMCQAFAPLLRRSAHGRIVNVSSEDGSLAGIGPGAPAYNLSKAALNALTRMLAAELRRDKILVNSVCPGWVATDMGGDGGRPVEDGAAGVVWAATLPDDGPTGGFFLDGSPLPW